MNKFSPIIQALSPSVPVSAQWGYDGGRDVSQPEVHPRSPPTPSPRSPRRPLHPSPPSRPLL